MLINRKDQLILNLSEKLGIRKLKNFKKRVSVSFVLKKKFFFDSKAATKF